MNNRIVLLIILFSFWKTSSTFSIPAYPKKIAVKIGNSIQYIRLFGDEYNKHAETLDGFSIIQKDEEWYYAEKDEEGYLKASLYKLSGEQDERTKDFLEKTPKHLTADKISQRKIQAPKTRQDTENEKVIGNRRVLVILMQYKDFEFIKSKEDFHQLFNEKNYTEDGAKGSVSDFYNEVSYGKLQLKCDIIGPFTSKNERSYYGSNDREGNDRNPTDLFLEAMEYASNEVNFIDYDSNEDGYIDNIHIIYAGHGEEAGASANAIWAHEATFMSPFEYQGIKVDRYSCAPELRGDKGKGISRIGPHCHEIGHALGALDYYDTNYGDGGGFEGTGVWDVMAAGSWNNEGILPADFNPYVKMADFGWIEVQEMPQGEVTLQPSIFSDANYYRLSNSENDYYLVENRSLDKWGEALPGSGLLIFHIHPNLATVGNKINATYPQKCYPVCASSKYSTPTSQPYSYGEINSDGCPFPGTSRKNQFNNSTTPAAFSWIDDQSFVNIKEIQQNSDNSISLINFSKTSESTDSNFLLHDDFEKPKKYETIYELGETNWNRIVVDNSEKNKNSISPHNGSCHLRFSPNKFAETKQESTIQFTSQKASQKGFANLSFYYQGVSFRPDSLILQIAYKCDDNEWESYNIVGNGKSGWKFYSILLPEAEIYQLSFTGNAVYGQSIYIDDIEIVQRIPDDIRGVKPTESTEFPKSGNSIYNLLGKKLTTMRKGLNILRDNDGNVRKVFVR